MARRRQRKKFSSAQFTRAIPRLSIRDIDRYVRQVGGKLTQAQRDRIKGREASARYAKQAKEAAKAAVKKFKPKRADRGKIIFLGKRKGYAVYVTSTGKKWLLKSPTDKPYQTQRKRDIELPLRKNLRKKIAEFQKRRLVETRRGKSLLRGSGKASGRGRADFKESVVNKIAKSLKQTIEGQASHRTFLIEVNLLLRHSDGGKSATSFSVPIDKADHISIRLGGLKNFVSQKFYAYLARALQYMGFISAGSAAHIKRVTGKKVTEAIWEQYHSDAGHSVPGWSAPRFEVVTIEQIEWRILQAK